VKIVSLSWVTGSVSNSNLSAFDVIGSKAREMVGDARRRTFVDIVTNGNKVSFP